MLQEKVLDEFLVGNDADEGDLDRDSKAPDTFTEGTFVENSIHKSAVLESAVPESSMARLRNRISDALLDRSIVLSKSLRSERGDVPGWVLVVLMTTGLVTGIWTLAAPRIDSILRNSLDSMNGIR